MKNLHARTVRTRLNVLSILFLGALVSSVSLSAGGQPEAATAAAPPNAAEARIVFLIGDVTIDGQDVQIGDVVQAGSVVRTGPGSEADLTFGSGNALRVRENTELTLNLGDSSEGLDVRQGTIAAVFEGLSSVGLGADDPFRIRTPSTVAGVRGTAFFMHVVNGDQTYVCTCHGILEFEETGLVVRSARHDARRFIRTAEGLVSQPAPEIYHDTESLNRVAQVAGVTIEWGVDPDD